MAWIDGIFASKAAKEAKAAAAPGTGGAASRATGVANPSAHPNTMVTGEDGKQLNPLDGFAALFKPATGADGKPVSVQQTDWNAPYVTTVKDEDLNKAAAGLDFTVGINPELVTKALAGDATSLLSLMNHVGQQAFTANAKLSSGLADQSARAVATRVNGSLDSHVRNIAVREQNPTNEALMHETVKPVYDGLKLMIAANNPKMPAIEVAKQAEQLLVEMGKAATSKTGDTKKQVDEGPDWSHIG